MRDCHVDFETRSAVDLKKTGVYPYSLDDSTDVWCAAFAFDDGPVHLWEMGQTCPPEIVEHVSAGGRISAWNAQFERVIWWNVMSRRHGWPKPKLEQFRCVMVQAHAMSLPASLENAAAALGLEAQKDMAGARLCMQMCRPRKNEGGVITWWDDEDRRRRLGAYCKQDVVTEREADKRLLPLRQDELDIYHLDQRINDRGLRVDLTSCRHAQTAVEAAKKNLDKAIRKVSGNTIASCTAVADIVRFLKANGVPDADSIAKDQILLLLDRKDLSAPVRTVLELRQEAAKSSTAKIKSALEMAGADGRVRGLFQYHGAGTGRWAGRGLQPHNLPRDMPKPKLVEAFFDILPKGHEALDLVFDSTQGVISRCLRGFVTAEPGNELLVADFSSIEARVLAWLSGQESMLDIFRSGQDPYNHAATAIYGRPIDRKKNADDFMPGQVGKVSILALGYEGGIAAFAAMAKNYNVDMADVYPRLWASADEQEQQKAIASYNRYKAKAEVPVSREFALAADITKQRWRRDNPLTVQHWADLKAAAVEAVKNPGSVHQVGKVRYRVSGSFLWCQLPSGRCLCYPYPKLKMRATNWNTMETVDVEPGTEDRYGKGWSVSASVRFMTVNSMTKHWGPSYLYGGLQAENNTQAVARDLLAEAMVRSEAAGYPVVLHVHDEIVSEVAEGSGRRVWDAKAECYHDPDFEEIMTQLPDWAAGCPVGAEGFVSWRYRK